MNDSAVDGRRPSRGALLALDFGGTKLTAGVAASPRQSLRWLARDSCPTPASGGASRAAMVEMARNLLSSTGTRPVGIGVSFGGPVDSAAGRVRRSMHVSGWDDVPLAAEFADLFGAPVRLANDARAGALGEWRYGTGGARGSLFYLTVSTGVGGGLVVGGEPVEGASGLAGEVGHLTVDRNGPLCSCGRHGCVEAMASGPAIARAAAHELARRPELSPALAALSRTDEGLTGKSVADAATEGDAFAAEVMAAAGRAAGFAVAAVIAVTDPDVVAVGGGVAKSGESFWTSLRETAQAAAIAAATTKITPAEFIDIAPLAGALVLAERVAAEELDD